MSRDLEQAISLLETLPGAHLLLDRGGVVRYISDEAAELLGATPDGSTGRDLFREIAPGLEAVAEQFRSLDWRSRARLVQEVDPGPTDAEKGLRVEIRAWEAAGRQWALVTLTARGLEAAERARWERAERLAAVGELAAGAAHEINNPLASIKGFAQLLARDTLDQSQLQALEIISQECTRVASIVDSLLDFATQQWVVGCERVNLSTVAQDVLALKRYSLETSGITVETDLDESVSPISGEKGAFQRLVLILLNQIERSLAAQGSRPSLTVRTRETNEGVALYLSDNGAGIPRDSLPTMLDGPADPEVGLGPSTAKRIVIEHGGSIWVESAEGRGTTFTIRFPRATIPAVPAPAPEPPPEPVAPPTLESTAPVPERVRVLVADDEPMLRLALSMFLNRHGYEVEQAENADEAFNLAATGAFQVALIDVKMPGDGLRLVDRLDALDAWTGHAIVMTGDHVESQNRTEGRDSCPYLTKPFDMMDAVRLIDSLVHEDFHPRQGSGN